MRATHLPVCAFLFCVVVVGEDGVSVRVPAKSTDCRMMQFVPSVGRWSGCSRAAPRNMAASDRLEHASIIYYRVKKGCFLVKECLCSLTIYLMMIVIKVDHKKKKRTHTADNNQLLLTSIN